MLVHISTVMHLCYGPLCKLTLVHDIYSSLYDSYVALWLEFLHYYAKCTVLYHAARSARPGNGTIEDCHGNKSNIDNIPALEVWGRQLVQVLTFDWC